MASRKNNKVNKIIVFIYIHLLHAIYAQSTITGLFCQVKYDASYAAYTQWSNDAEAYKTFFNKRFEECGASKILPEDQTTCAIKREVAYSMFTHFSDDMHLFERLFATQHQGCGNKHVEIDAPNMNGAVGMGRQILQHHHSHRGRALIAQWNQQTTGKYSLAKDIKTTAPVTVNGGLLDIRGVVDSNGTRPAIDGGRSHRLFLVLSGTLSLTNISITNGHVRTISPSLFQNQTK